jgi:hypothetical protein
MNGWARFAPPLVSHFEAKHQRRGRKGSQGKIKEPKSDNTKAKRIRIKKLPPNPE